MAVQVMTLDDLGIEEIEATNATIEEIDAEAIDILFVALDESGSMSKHKADMIPALQDFKTSMQNSKESEHILVARLNFHDIVEPVGGYQPIDDFDASYTTYGGTLLYDGICEGAEKFLAYIKYLKANGMRVKGVFSTFSDGEDNTSYNNQLSDATRVIAELNAAEYPTVFIAFGQEALDEANRLGYSRIVDIVNTPDPGKALRAAFNRLSKSVVEYSKHDGADADNFTI